MQLTSDHPGALPLDIEPIQHAILGSPEVAEGYGWEVWSEGNMGLLLDLIPSFPEMEGRLGLATLLLSEEELTCADTADGGFVGSSSGVLITYGWWTTATTDPDWTGDYGVGSALGDDSTARFAILGGWTEQGVTVWPEPTGTAGLSTAGGSAEGDLATDVLDATFVAEACAPGEGA